LSRARYLDIGAAIRTTPSAVVVFGDSLVLGAPLPNAVCGTPIVNAGVGGAGIRYFERYGRELLGTSTPKLIVLAVGLNDAHAGSVQAFRSRYQATVAKLAHYAPVLLATVTPVQPGSFSYLFDPEIVPRLNETITEIAGAGGVIALNRSLDEPNLTTDGIHLNSRGYEFWTKAVIERVTKALGCHIE
jgi:lysophospholipase L1-like esterase